VFGPDDETLAQALAAQCAVALTRAQMTAAAIEGERLKREMELARVVQMSSLPAAMPQVAGYELHGEFQPAEETGGDTYDLAQTAQGVLVVLGDATGHGIAPALAVTQMHAMLRMALQLGTALEEAFRHVNDALARTLPEGRFVTAFVGLLDPQAHRLAFVSGGQAPILLYRAASGTTTTYGASSFPMGAMPLPAVRPATRIDLEPGDLLAVLSDGVFEAEDAAGAQFGRERIEALLHAGRDAPAASLGPRLLEAVRTFCGDAPQGDDVTMVFVRRTAA
jgi:phosphoserine phosphatase